MAAETVQTPYGIYGGVTSTDYYPDGKLQSICLEERNVILTHAGELIPFYGDETLRRKHKASVTFHQNGMIKAIALAEQQEVMTPIGSLPAELITFYDTGEICRAFPLDGKLSGFWSEEDERALNVPLTFDLGFTSFTAMISGIGFYKSGQIKSITLFPKEIISVAAAHNDSISTRQGFSLFENGALASLEPAEPTLIETPIGFLSAYDVTAHGINADINSLAFDEHGRVTRIVTSTDKIAVQVNGIQTLSTHAPRTAFTTEDDSVMIQPLSLSFDYDDKTVHITDPVYGMMCYPFSSSFILSHGKNDVVGCASGDCSTCHLCD